MARWRAMLAAAAAAAVFGAAGSAGAAATAPATPPEHVRGVEQTFLTYPEWFLVFSPAEYARYVRTHAPDGFPFWGHVRQFWHGYYAVTRESRARGDALNPGYHLMIAVIGTSTSVEYAIRWVYESLLGRLSAAMDGADTPEDHYAARVAQDYVDFIRVLPWYEYDFARQLKGLWTDVPWTGAHMVRKWERRFALSTEYGIKAGYGQIIKLATRSIYETPLLVTAVVTQPAPRPDARMPQLKVLRSFADGSALATVPRYDAFMAYAQGLAAQGVEFREIAGNDSIILVSLIGARDWTPRTGVDRRLLTEPILTDPAHQRVLATVQVRQLGAALREWERAGVQVEHVFDY